MVMPLENIRVLDLTRLLPGLYSSQTLADFGAEVIKVEDLKEGDYTKSYELKVENYSALNASLNRNKKSVTLNLKEDIDREYFFELVKTADVLVESFRPGVMEELGVGYEKLKNINSGLVYCAITGYGQTGPYKDKAGHDINYLSYAGLLNFQGNKREKPIVPSTQFADIGGGLKATVGILIALMNKVKTDKGQFVDISMTDVVITWLQTILPDYLSEQDDNRGEFTLSGGKASYGVYETADQRYLAVGALEPKFWEVFCEGIGRSDFIPFNKASLNVQAQLKIEIEHIILKKTLNEWMEVFQDLEACVSPVLNFEEMMNDPQIKDRKMILDINNLKQIGIAIKLWDTPGKIHSPAPELGEHNNELLTLPIKNEEE